MKSIRVLLSILAFTLLGCEEIILEDDNKTSDTLVKGDEYLPDIKESEGVSVKLADYLYPDGLVEDKTFTFESIYSYSEDAPASYREVDILQRSFTKAVNGSVATIAEFKGKKQITYDEIHPDKIITYSYKLPVDLKLKVAKNDSISVSDIVKDSVIKRCVVKNIGAMDISLKLPHYVKTDLLKGKYLNMENGAFSLSQFNFESVMYIHCGTSDRKIIESYYSKKYGRVLRIEKDIDKDMFKVEVVDVESVVNN